MQKGFTPTSEERVQAPSLHSVRAPSEQTRYEFTPANEKRRENLFSWRSSDDGAKTRRGFTLIELLVVIAIIGILSSVVLGSLSVARTKARDTRRIEDIKQIETALSLYFDTCKKYPPSIYAAYSACTGGIAPNYIPVVPSDPVGGLNYTYAALDTNSSAASCESYHIGVVLEESTNSALSADADPASTGSVCTGGGTDFLGTDPIYDKKP
jgi:prepilin-type N-terminal cleavage/methylation domain-containing protein